MSYPSYPGAGGYNQGGGGYGQGQPNYQGGSGYGGGPGGYGAAAGAGPGGPGGQYNPYQQQYGQQGYGAPPGALPPSVPGISPETQRWFNMVDRDRSGKINAIELKSALVNGKGENFSDNACKLMIGMFDLDHSGTIDIHEFDKLFGYINQWLTVFKTYDRDGSGQIDENELTQALTQMGFRFSSDFVKFLVAKSDPIAHKNISVDQFIVLCVQIQRFTEAFRVRDREQKGLITINFEDFLTVAIGSSI